MFHLPLRTSFAALVVLSLVAAAEFVPPAADRYCRVTETASILPGGRIIQPSGSIIDAGPGTFALAISPRGTVATTDIGPDRFGITLINRVKETWETRHLWARTPNSNAAEIAEPDWKGVSSGIAFENEKAVWVSEGGSGRVRLVDINSGNHLKIVDLNQGEWHESFTAGLALDPARRLLFVLDQRNSRMAVIDSRKGQVLSSVRVAGRPLAISLSPAGETVCIVTAGESGISLVSTNDPLKPTVTDSLSAGPSPSDLLATADRIFVSNPNTDSIYVLSAATHKQVGEIRLGIPGLNGLRGIIPSGMAFDSLTGWLLVAESGINAVGVIDTHNNALIAHIPAGWFPTHVAIMGDRVYVANMRGRGTGPNLRRPLLNWGEPAYLHHGTVSTFIMPSASELPKLTGLVYAAGGLAPHLSTAPDLPAEIRHVVLIVKESRAFDEILGDLGRTDMHVAAMPQLARFGMHGIADGNRVRFSVHDAAITPNQHSLAIRWAFSDNFYADSESNDEGREWLLGRYPLNRLVPLEYAEEEATMWEHFQRNGIAYARFGETHEPAVSDQLRADRFIEELRRRYGPGREELPRVLYISLPNDGTEAERPSDGYPYGASFVADNDLAVGRVVEYLSSTPWWKQITIFITEASAEGGLDHVDSHRTLLLAAGPWVRRNYVIHTNADFPAVEKIVFQLLRVPPLNLMDATAANLGGLFTSEPDFAPYRAEIPDKRVFNPLP